MIRKKYILSLILCTISFLSLAIFAIFYSGVEENNSNEIELLFAKNYISYITDGDIISFNIFGVQKENKADLLKSELISDIRFENENIEITEYSVDTGISYNNYRLFNFIVTARPLYDGLEKSDRLLISFNDGEIKAYDIGRVILQTKDEFSHMHITPDHEYRLSYSIPSFEGKLKNTSSDVITINKIEDLNKQLIYYFKPNINIEPGKTENIIVPSFEINNDYDFYTVTPILYYSTHNLNYNYYLPTVIFGILDSDEKKIKKITSQTNKL